MASAVSLQLSLCGLGSGSRAGTAPRGPLLASGRSLAVVRASSVGKGGGSGVNRAKQLNITTTSCIGNRGAVQSSLETLAFERALGREWLYTELNINTETRWGAAIRACLQ